MSTQWYCRILHEEFGPIDLDELQDLALSGTLDRGDLVRRNTSDVWMAASKCLELRATFGKLAPLADSQPIRHAATSGEGTARPEPASEETTSGRAVASQHVRLSISPRQRWIAWSVTTGMLLVMYLADRLISSAAPTFPKPRQVREQLAGLHWFLGSGPWSHWECGLLWVDALVIISFVSGWITRRMTR